ncbi:protein of unknown function DUF323 [alpha proteobacterium U9-1i]|nr:protein of unknown function DUF323 [alpha proteobacterium U9-1i]
MAECDVFISYKREERPRVELVAQKLKAVGLKVWFDTSLSAGATFDEQIAGALKGAKCVLVCWTPGAIASDWVRAEAAMGHSANKLVAAFLEPTDLIPPFNLIHAENLADWSGEDDHAGWAKILARVASMSGQAGLADWAKMMGDGDARAVRAWVAAQPAGPLRSTTRFWLSEMNAQPIFGSSRPPAPRANKKGGAGGLLAALAFFTLLGVGGYFAWRTFGADPSSTTAQTPAGAAPGASAIVTPRAAAAIELADGSTLRAVAGSLVDFESGRMGEADDPAYDFEIAFTSRYEWRPRGDARMQTGHFDLAPSRRQCDELQPSDFQGVAYPAWRASPRFQCFITGDGHRGFVQHVDGYDDPATGLEFVVTFFR